MSDNRLVLRIFFRTLLVLLLSTPLIALLLALQGDAGVPVASPLSAEEVSRVERIIVENAPGSVSSTTEQTVGLDQEELNLLLRYAMELLQLDGVAGSSITLTEQSLRGQVSLPLWSTRLPVWLNLGADFTGVEQTLALESLQLGQLRIPARLVTGVLNRLRLSYLAGNPAYEDLRELAGSIRRISLQEDELRVDLLWEPQLIARIFDQARYFLITAEDQQRIIRHYQLLHDLIAATPESTRAISLNALLVPMFGAVMAAGGAATDPVAENRTLLLTLALYVNNEDLSQLLGPLAEGLPRARTIEVRVQRRQDLAQHIATSAAISASAGAGLAEILSSTKEAYDARYRSGYSFSDLTANTAGVALGRLATADAETARIMQQRLATLTGEGDYLPGVGNNQDGISEADFNALYRDNVEEYQRRLREIEALVYALPLFAGL